jgi:hypothetical protein
MKEDFSQYNWLEFIKYLDFHIKVKEWRKGDYKDKYNITEDLIDVLKRLNSEPEHPWIPFMAVIDPFSEKYVYRIKNFAVRALKYLKEHQDLITPEMKEIMLKSPSIMGKYIISGENLPTPLVPNAPITLQSQQLSIITDSVEYLQKLIKEAKKRDVSELSLKDILSAMPKIVDAINKMQNRQVKVGSLTQINLNGSAEDIENGMLAMLNKDE